MHVGLGRDLFAGRLRIGLVAGVLQERDAGEVAAVRPDEVGHEVPFVGADVAGVGDIVVQLRRAGLRVAAGDDPALLHKFDEFEKLHRGEVLAQDRLFRRLDREGNHVVGIGIVHRDLGHLGIHRLEEAVNRLLAVGLHAAEITARMVGMNAGGGVEDERSRALGLAGADLRGRADVDQAGDEAVGGAAQARALGQDLLVEEHAGVVHETADGDAQERIVLVEEAGHGSEIGHVGVRRLQRADGGRGEAGLVERRFRDGRMAVDGREVAMLETREAHRARQVALVAVAVEIAQLRGGKLPVHHRQQADLGAGIAAGVGIVAEVKTGFAKLLLGAEELAEVLRVVVAARQDGRVVGGGTLGILVKPVAGLGIHHLLVVG